MKIFIPNRKNIWWWNFVHYNYFHKKLFKEFYGSRKKFTKKQIRKYHFYQWVDDIITLRKVGWYHNLLFKYEDRVIFKTKGFALSIKLNDKIIFKIGK